MAEHRRIPFETVKPVNKEKKVNEPAPTFRFSLPLDESNEKTCPEFSYGELVKSARQEEKKEVSSDEPFGEEEDDQKLKELARKFEEKYGPKVGNKKRKSMGRWEDYIDRGMGYDESDPFIDNDEAYDELVPSTLTTQFGGFYINSGELEFRNVSENDSDGPQDGVKRRRRRRRRDAEEKDFKKRRGLGRDGNMSPRGRGRRPGMDRSASALAKAKRKAQPTVASLLQERKAQMLQNQHLDQNQPQVVEIQEQQYPPPKKEAKKEIIEEPLMMAESPLPAPVISSSEDEDAFLEMIDQQLGSDDKSENNINDIIESVIRNSEDVLNNGNLLMYAGGGSSDGDEVGLTIADVEAPKLPENLSNELNELVKKIKQAAITSEQGKCKFFSHEVNKMLLSIELKSRELSCTQRSMIYSHLASYLPCTKETLLKRAKKLRLDQEDGKLHEPMQRLKNGIGEYLPAMVEKYSAACLAASEIKLEPDEAPLPEDADDSQGKEEKKGIKLPKRKFEWNENMRELLCEVVRIKLKCFEVSKLRAQSAEDYLQQFLDQEVGRLWPPGWVNTRMLLKESRSAHAYVTAVKPPKKPLLAVKKLTLPGQSPQPGELVPSSPLVKYANIPQSMMVPELQPLADNLAIPLQPLEEIPDEIPLPKGVSVSSEERASKVGLPASAFLDANTLEPAVSQTHPGSPSKRIFTLMNTEEAAQVVEAHKSSSQKSFAATMLDRIICASLADFPNSGTSTASVTIERSQRPPKAEPVQKPGLQQQGLQQQGLQQQGLQQQGLQQQGLQQQGLQQQGLQQQGLQQQDVVPKSESVLMKAPPVSHMLAEAGKSPGTIYTNTPAVSILKSNYQTVTNQPQLQPQVLQQQPRPNRILEHPGSMATAALLPSKQMQQSRILEHSGTITSSSAVTKHVQPNRILDHPVALTTSSPLPSKQLQSNRVIDHPNSMPTTSTALSNKQISSNSKSSPLGRPSHASSLPMQSYKFQEAFQRSLAVSSSSNIVPSNEHPNVRNYPRKRQVSDESDDQPVNFSNPQTNAHYVASQELNRLASATMVSTPYVSQASVTTAPAQVPRSSPESTYTVSAFAEGMKGFPLPLKSVVNPPPAHSYPSNRRTSPGTEAGFTSPHRHNSTSPHQMASSTHSPPQSVANHAPYQTTSPLSHFTPPDSHNPRAIIQTAWRNSTTNSNISSTSAPSSGYSMPSQYSTASSPNYGLSTSAPSHNQPSVHPFLPAAAPTGQRGLQVKGYPSSNHLASSQQSQQVMQRGHYGQMYPTGTGFPSNVNRGQVPGPFPDGNYSLRPSQQHSNFHSGPLPSVAGQQGSHTRIP